MTDVDWGALERAAREARGRAYAPYSNYLVGAALLAGDGRIFLGCNVENASYGLTICAERTALVSMVAAGVRALRAAVVVTAGAEPGSPCGMCRQSLAEFCDDAPVRLIGVDAAGLTLAARETSVAALLPERFRGELVTGPRR